MTARRCFSGKIAAGKVSGRAGRQVLGMMDEFERQHQARLGDGAGARQAALDALEATRAEAARKADTTRGTLIAQANVERAFAAYEAKVTALRDTPGDFLVGNKAPPTLGKETQTPLGFAMRSLLARDPWEISTWSNVHSLARDIRGRAHAAFADAIEFLRPKNLGFTPETTRELDVLRALYGASEIQPQARPVAEAWSRVAENLRQQFVDAGGALPERKEWRLPNPALDPDKVAAFGAERFKQFARERVDRAAMLDFSTGKPMTDARFEQLLTEAFEAVTARGLEGEASGAPRGRRMLANSRDLSRFFVWKDADAWLQVAEAFGQHASVYEAMLGHIAGMSDDIAMMRVLGPNPEATKRYITDLFDREAQRLAVTAETGDDKAIAAAARSNRAIGARVRTEKKLFEDLYAEVSGLNKVPVNTTMAVALSNMRNWLSATQMGSAIISSLSDAGTLAMISAHNGLPVMNVLGRAIEMAGEKGSEIFAAQQGLVADSLAHVVGQNDRVMGETIRTNLSARLSAANIRLSGLRRWSSVLRAAFGLEMMAHAARERGKVFGELEPQFRQALERYGMGATEWDLIRNTTPHEPRPNALLLRPLDVAAAGTPAHRQASEGWARLINTEMDYAVIETDPLTRAMLVGDSRPGTIAGEARRAVGMYKQFPATFMTMHFARAFARGWDGSRLQHAALTFLTMTTFGALSMQLKEMNAGRDPLNLNPTTGNGARAWGKAILQGGGLGVFGDIVFVDQSKYGNTWAATIAGPQFAAVEKILGDTVMKNVIRASKGERTTLAGDALYAAASYLPGSSLWGIRLPFQRAVVDQAALMIDPRAPERFARIEAQARKDWGQDYWLPPGRTEPRRAPDLSAVVRR